MSSQVRATPLHALSEHVWEPVNVRRFFLFATWAMTGWGAWGMTAWRDTNNANNAVAAVIVVVMFSIIAVILTLVHLWKWEERRLAERQERAARIRLLEEEVFGDA